MNTSRILRARFAAAICALSIAVVDARAQSGIAGFGPDWYGLTTAPPLPPGRTYVQVAAGLHHAVALRSDGTAVAWGVNEHGCTDVPPLPQGLQYVQAAAGEGHTVLLRSDGWIVAFGRNFEGQCGVPQLPPAFVYVQVVAGSYHTLALRSDGAVLGFGWNMYGQCTAPPFPPGLACVEIATSGDEFSFGGHSLARMSDGSVIAWGETTPAPRLPPGVAYVEIDAAEAYSVARRSDGVVVVWGYCPFSIEVVPVLPPGMHYTQIATGSWHILALRSDGAVVGWGSNDHGVCDAPPLAADLRYVQVAAGASYSLARYEGCATCELPFCLGDAGPRSQGCPCGNTGARGRGCENSASTGGAKLSVHGSVDPDRVVLETSGTLPSSACVYFQGSSVLEGAQVFGDGARCIGGALERIAVRTAVAGASTYPVPGDPSLRARSAELGDPIAPGTFRYYQVLYRDPSATFCSPETLNASNAVMVAW